jgi:chemotaxis protein CheX
LGQTPNFIGDGRTLTREQNVADSSGVSTLLLSPVLDLRAAEPLAQELRALRGKPIEIDASKVERIGGLCAQLLLASRNAWQADELAWSIIDPSPEFEECLDVLSISLGQEKNKEQAA